VYQIPRGTRDFTSEEMQKRKLIEENIRSSFKNYGYKEVKTPIFETLELFTAKSGEAIISEIYSFSDKSGRNLALRPELTAPTIRLYVDKLQMEPKPLKLYYFGNCYRYDRPQKGRYREFTQAGCEIIGVDTPESTAELIAMGYNILKNTGLKNIELNIGDLNILSIIFEKLRLSKENQQYLVPLIDKSMFEEVLNALSDFGINSKDASIFVEILQTDDIEKIREYIKDSKKAKEEISKLNDVLTILKESLKIKYKIKMSIVRGLDYYKGIVFEIEAPDLGAERQLCGGGAYELIPLFGGTETPTAGFAIGFDRTILALEHEKYVFPTMKTDVYIIPVNKDMINISIEIAQTLRKKNLIVDIDLMRRGVSKSLKYASSIKTSKAIIIGPKELEKNIATIRDMTSGEQVSIKIKEISEYFQG